MVSPANGPAARFTLSRTCRRISRTEAADRRWRKTRRNWRNCCSTKRASRWCPAMHLARPDIYVSRMRRRSSASTKDCAVSIVSFRGLRLRLDLNPAPQRLEPIFSPRIWGNRSLAPLFPDKTDLAEPLGEAWLTSVDSRIATSEFRGKTLGAAWREMPAEWRGTQFSANDQFPLLVKFIFPTDMLSLQVHPDDAYASVHEKAAGGRGKTEMWHVVSAEPGAELLFGLKPGSNKQQFLARLKDQTLESIFQPVDVS